MTVVSARECDGALRPYADLAPNVYCGASYGHGCPYII
jgi:hypothetical protein